MRMEVWALPRNCLVVMVFMCPNYLLHGNPQVLCVIAGI